MTSLDGLRALEQAACPFCEYAGPCELLDVYRGVYFIDPISPVTDGHVLAIPFAHVTDVIADPEIAGDTMRAAAWFAADRCVGECNLITSVGEAATQTVKHLHVHIVPRSEGDGLALPWSSLARVEAAEAERDALLFRAERADAKIAEALGWLRDYCEAEECRPYLVTEAIGDLNWARDALAASVPSGPAAGPTTSKETR